MNFLQRLPSHTLSAVLSSLCQWALARTSPPALRLVDADDAEISAIHSAVAVCDVVGPHGVWGVGLFWVDLRGSRGVGCCGGCWCGHGGGCRRRCRGGVGVFVGVLRNWHFWFVGGCCLCRLRLGWVAIVMFASFWTIEWCVASPGGRQLCTPCELKSVCRPVTQRPHTTHKGLRKLTRGDPWWHLSANVTGHTRIQYQANKKAVTFANYTQFRLTALISRLQSPIVDDSSTVFKEYSHIPFSCPSTGKWDLMHQWVCSEKSLLVVTTRIGSWSWYRMMSKFPLRTQWSAYSRKTSLSTIHSCEAVLPSYACGDVRLERWPTLPMGRDWALLLIVAAQFSCSS